MMEVGRLFICNGLAAKIAPRKPSIYGPETSFGFGVLKLGRFLNHNPSHHHHHIHVLVYPINNIIITTLIFLLRCIMDNQAMFTAQQMQYKQMYAGIDPTGR